jgi:hypothetical protein
MLMGVKIEIRLSESSQDEEMTTILSSGNRGIADVLAEALAQHCDQDAAVSFETIGRAVAKLSSVFDNKNLYGEVSTPNRLSAIEKLISAGEEIQQLTGIQKRTDQDSS